MIVTREKSAASLFLDKLPGDHQALNLARSLSDRAQLGNAPEFLNGIILAGAVSAKDLYGLLCQMRGRLFRNSFMDSA